MRYLMVLPVPWFPVGDGKAAIESAFGRHLVQLLQSLSDRVTDIEVLAPRMQHGRYEAERESLVVLDAEHDRIRFSEAFADGRGRLVHLLALPRLVVRVWRAVGRARWVHAGPSPLWLPFENIALLLGTLRRRRTVFVQDIDHRRSASMNVATGAWSRGVAWRRRHVHDVWAALQLAVACRVCSLVLLKGRKLLEDFGGGRPHVRYILDCAHSADMVPPAAERDRRIAALAADRELRVCYFGRLVRYKGVDRMLRAVHAAVQAGARVRFDVYGGGDCLDELRRLTTSLGLDAHVRFLGARRYGPAFFAELQANDLLLAAPLSEDTPRSAVDAQALGIGVLAFDTYYYRELAAAGAAVRVVPWPDVQALADVLVELQRDRSQLPELARRGYAFALDNTQEQWLQRRAQWTLALG